MLFVCCLKGLRGQSAFTKSQVREDLAYLRTSLEEAHYNLYAYTTKKEFDSIYSKVKKSINKDSLSLLEATSLFQNLISSVKNGHTEISFPGQAYGEYVYGGGTVFPLELAFEYNQALVRKNWSGNDEILKGAAVIAINGMPMSTILSRIYPLISAERPYFKNTKIELFSFPRYYWQAFGAQQNFDVVIRNGQTTQEYRLKAVPALEGYEMKRNETVMPERKLEFYGTAAYLNPGNFSGEELKYRAFIDSAFIAIKKHDASNLIVDLRNNLGGEDSFSDYLVSYFADKPFTWASELTLKTSALLKEDIRKNRDSTQAYWQEALSRKNGEQYSYELKMYPPQPAQKRFTGKVHVLINRQSHSQATVTAAQIQDYGFGTLVGEETAEYPTLYASVFRYQLPNTGVSVQVSKGQIVRVNGSTKEQGVVPDIFIKDHLLDEDDEILNGLLKSLQ